MKEVKSINISVSVNALGRESGFGRMIPIEDFPVGEPVRINPWLPDHYQKYVKPIDLIRTEDELKVETSYKLEKYDCDSKTWIAATAIDLVPRAIIQTDWIGLSYASCQISISPEDFLWT